MAAVVGGDVSMICRCIQLDTTEDWSGLGRKSRPRLAPGEKAYRSPEHCTAGLDLFRGEPPVEGRVQRTQLLFQRQSSPAWQRTLGCSRGWQQSEKARSVRCTRDGIERRVLLRSSWSAIGYGDLRAVLFTARESTLSECPPWIRWVQVSLAERGE